MNTKQYVKRMKEKKKKNNRIVSADGEKSCDKIQYPFMIKNIQQTSNRKLPQHNKNNM